MVPSRHQSGQYTIIHRGDHKFFPKSVKICHQNCRSYPKKQRIKHRKVWRKRWETWFKHLVKNFELVFYFMFLIFHLVFTSRFLSLLNMFKKLIIFNGHLCCNFFLVRFNLAFKTTSVEKKPLPIFLKLSLFKGKTQFCFFYYPSKIRCFLSIQYTFLNN